MPITLVVVAMAAMVAVSLMYRSTAELQATGHLRDAQQARAAAMSGIHRVMSMLDDPQLDPALLENSQELLANQLVWQDATVSWYFTVYAPDPEDPNSVRYGLIDEAGKININVADEDTLTALGLDEEQLECLLDWRDDDDVPRPNGAEQEYYSALRPVGYLTGNGPLATIESLLLVKGFDAAALFGEDANRNGMLDANEDDASETFPPDDGDGVLAGGVAPRATTFTSEPDIDSEGRPRININTDTLPIEELEDAGLPEQTLRFIQLYRAEGGTFRHPSALLGMEYRLREDHPAPLEGKANEVISSDVDAEALAVVLDRLTTRDGGREARWLGLVNVNSASVDVLASLPDIDENLAQRIVDERSVLSSEERRTIAWLYGSNLVDAETFQRLAERLTARSFQVRLRCMGFRWPSGQFCTLEAVIDRSEGKSRIVYLRDLTRVGRPLTPEVDVVETGF